MIEDSKISNLEKEIFEEENESCEKYMTLLKGLKQDLRGKRLDMANLLEKRRQMESDDVDERQVKDMGRLVVKSQKEEAALQDQINLVEGWLGQAQASVVVLQGRLASHGERDSYGEEEILQGLDEMDVGLADDGSLATNAASKIKDTTKNGQSHVGSERSESNGLGSALPKGIAQEVQDDIAFFKSQGLSEKEIHMKMPSNLPINYGGEYPVRQFMGKIQDACRCISFPVARYTMALLTCLRNEADRDRVRREVISVRMSWEDTRRYLEVMFQSALFRLNKGYELDTTRQAFNQTAAAYGRHYESLVQEAGVPRDTLSSCMKFVRSLKPELMKLIMVSHGPRMAEAELAGKNEGSSWTLKYFIQLAQTTEASLHLAQYQPGKGNGYGGRSGSIGRESNGCFYRLSDGSQCGATDHIARNHETIMKSQAGRQIAGMGGRERSSLPQWVKTADGQVWLKKQQCHACQQYGHLKWMSECPKAASNVGNTGQQFTTNKAGQAIQGIGVVETEWEGNDQRWEEVQKLYEVGD